jgi:hypothetical protein
MLEKKIAELKDANPGLVLRKVTIGDEVFVVRPPSAGEWKRYEAARADGSGAARNAAAETLVKFCVLHPETAELNAIVERLPGITVPLFEKVLEYSGAAMEVHDEKL